MLDTVDGTHFELAVMDLMESYQEWLQSASAIEMFSDELHQHVEIAIQDMLMDAQCFSGINADDYNAQY